MKSVAVTPPPRQKHHATRPTPKDPPLKEELFSSKFNCPAANEATLQSMTVFAARPAYSSIPINELESVPVALNFKSAGATQSIESSIKGSVHLTPVSSTAGSVVKRTGGRINSIATSGSKTGSKSGSKSGAKLSSAVTIPVLGFGGPKITPDIYAQQFAGALPLESQVYCWYPAQRVWFSATIVYARPHGDSVVRIAQSEALKTTDTRTELSGSVVSSSKETGFETFRSSRQHYITPKVAEDCVAINPYQWGEPESAYDYYIHFHGEDRRQDMWAVITSLRPRDFQFHPDEPFLDVPPGPDEIHIHMDAEYLKEHEENTKLKTIGKILMGNCLVDTWYFSPYPKEFQNLDVLYICEFCLSFFKHQCELNSHSVICHLNHPPGDEIYRDVDKQLSLFEVDGSLSRKYAENLCFLSKLFLDHKTLKHPVYLFLFYILTEWHDGAYYIVGYFSKEKYSKNNLSCIMCLPQHQRKGYGQFLINMSYALARKEGKRGTPERPLSDLGRATYIKYWSQAALSTLLNDSLNFISLEQIAHQTSIEVSDIAMALESIGVLRHCQPRCVPYLFLPQENLEHIKNWAHSAFSTDLLRNSCVEAVESLLKKYSEEESEMIQKGPERRSKRRKTSATQQIDEVPPVANKIKPSDASHHKKNEQTNKKNSIIEPINLFDLKWESYDLHMGPFEFAPILS